MWMCRRPGTESGPSDRLLLYRGAHRPQGPAAWAGGAEQVKVLRQGHFELVSPRGNFVYDTAAGGRSVNFFALG